MATSSKSLISPEPNTFEIKHLYVLQRDRGNGRGKTLLSLLLTEISRLGYSAAYARVDRSDRACEKTLESAGFSAVGVEKSVSTSMFGGHTVFLNHAISESA